MHFACNMVAPCMQRGQTEPTRTSAVSPNTSNDWAKEIVVSTIGSSDLSVEGPLMTSTGVSTGSVVNDIIVD